MIKYLIVLGFCIYYGDFLDSLLEKPFIGRRVFFTTIYLGVLVICLLIDVIRKQRYSNNRVKKGDADLLLCCFILIGVYVFWAVIPQSDIMEVYNVVTFIMISYLTFYFSREYQMGLHILVVVFSLGMAFLLLQYINVGLPIYSFTDLNSVFFTANIYRVRYSFNFYQPNACGNYVYAMLVVSTFLLYCNGHSKLNGKIVRTITIIICDIFLANILLLTNSRNSLVGVSVYFLFIIFFSLINTKSINAKVRFILNGLVILSVILLVLINFGLISNLFVVSRRSENFTRNLPLLNSTSKILWGLGVVSPGVYGERTIWSSAFYVDNYYLYIILDFGIIGAVLIFSILANIGIKLHKNINLSNHDKLFELGFSFFLTQLIVGFGETCVIYPRFISSFLFLFISFICYDKNNSIAIIKSS